MKLLATLIAAIALCGAAVAEPTAGMQDNQSIPQVVVPEILSSPSMAATLSCPGHAYAYGAPVHLIFTITNHSKSTVDYQFASGQIFDAEIYDSSGDPIWNWSQHRVFSQLIRHVTIASGSSSEYTIVWNQRDNDDHPVPAGAYTATVTLIPMAKLMVSGNFLANPDNDPVNTGMPLMDSVQTGAVNIKNTTPDVYAKAAFTIEPNSD